MQELHLSWTVVGWVMSCFSLAGFLIALPMGFLLKIGYLKKIGTAGLVVLTLGSVLGACAPNTGLLLAGRVMEGFGLVTMGLISPVFISLWFSPEERSVPMGIWAAWIPLGSVAMFNLAGPMSAWGGWRGVWWFSAAVAFLALLLFIWLVAVPKDLEETENRPETITEEKTEKKFNFSAWKNRDLWLLSLMFAMMNFTLISYHSWAPTYLGQEFHFTAGRAAFYASFVHMGSILSNIGAGFLIKKLHSYRRVYMMGFFLLSLFMTQAFHLTENAIGPFMFGLGLVVGVIPSSTFAAAPTTIKNKNDLALAGASVIWGQNAGVLLGPSSLGYALSMGIDWPSCTLLLVLPAVLGLMLGWLTRVK